MRNDDASLTRCVFENLNIRSASQAFFAGRAQIAAAHSKAFHDVWRRLGRSVRRRTNGARTKRVWTLRKTAQDAVSHSAHTRLG